MRRSAFAVTACAACAVLEIRPAAALAPIDYRDTLDKAVMGPTVDSMFNNYLTPFVGYLNTYDDNLFRLPSGLTDLTTLTGIGLHPSRSDDINTVSAGVSAQWQLGERQSIDLGIQGGDSRYMHNTDLDNFSSDDSATWNWGFGTVLSGEIGAHYTRQLVSFMNTNVYDRDLVNHSEYFGSLQYQVGPHLTVFGGVMDATYSLSSHLIGGNDTRINSIEVGTKLFNGDGTNYVGVDYRYTDGSALDDIAVDGVEFKPDYHEESARFLTTYVLSDKSTVDANLGFLRRSYPDTPLITFSGWIGRVNYTWQLTDKTQIIARAYRQLSVDITAETDYFIATGGSIGPTWTPSEKFSIAVTAAYDHRAYLGYTPGVTLAPGRHDSLPSEGVIFTYNPRTALTITGTVSHEQRSTNEEEFVYTDTRASVGAVFKF